MREDALCLFFPIPTPGSTVQESHSRYKYFVTWDAGYPLQKSDQSKEPEMYNSAAGFP